MGVQTRSLSFRINSGKGGVIGRSDSDVRISRGDNNAQVDEFLKRAPHQGHGFATCLATHELV